MTTHPLPQTNPKTSHLGWNMDHTWLVRDGVWTLEGEILRADTKWSPLRARVEIGSGSALFQWEGEAGPHSLIQLPEQRPQSGSFAVTAVTENGSLGGRLEVHGTRQFMQARDRSSFWNETFHQLPDGSVESLGSLDRGEGRLTAWRWVLRPEATEETWTIPVGLETEILAAAFQGSPVEQCGLLVGRIEELAITGQIGMTNLDQSEDHFTIDPREQFRATKSLRGSGAEIVGSWHSHPYSPARLSDEDLAFSQDETALYGVVSLMDPDSPRLNIWKVAEGRARLVPLVVLPDTSSHPSNGDAPDAP